MLSPRIAAIFQTISGEPMKKLGASILVVAGALALCTLTGTGRSADDKAGVYKAILDAGTFQELVVREARLLSRNLEGTPKPEQIARAKLAAIMIAGFAASAGKNPKAAACNAQALDIAEALAKGNLNRAREGAAQLGRFSPTAGAAKNTPPDPKSILPEVMDVMNHLRTVKKGGDGLDPALQTSGPLKTALNGIEEKLRSLAKKALTPKAMAQSDKEMVYFGYRTAVLGSVIHAYAPAEKKGDQDPKEWRDLSLAMRDAAVSLARAAARKDANAVFKASDRLNSACTRCHGVFR
jgi:hypothetical protein